MSKLKIDVVMWTYNSATNLDKCLTSLDQALLDKNVCHRIAVDGGSEDDTKSVLLQHGWVVREAARRGIPYQANFALKLVDTEFFAAFEHDIILNPNWFERTTKVIDSDETFGAVQGIRLFAGSKTMRAFEEWQYRSKRIPVWSFSIDNTLFRTSAVRHAGGFSHECMASADTILRKNLFRLGYKWITDNRLISGHYRRDFFEQFRHQIRTFKLATYYWSSSPPNRSIPRRIISMLGGNPSHILNMTLQSRMLRVPLAWYILRFQRGLYLNLPHENKSVKAVAMDDWYLSKFEKAVASSSQLLQTIEKKTGGHVSPAPPYACAWCGQAAQFVFAVPRDWGNILPKLQPGVGQRFFACSSAHAEKTADKIFKEAFDYVTPEIQAYEIGSEG